MGECRRIRGSRRGLGKVKRHAALCAFVVARASAFYPRCERDADMFAVSDIDRRVALACVAESRSAVR